MGPLGPMGPPGPQGPPGSCSCPLSHGTGVICGGTIAEPSWAKCSTTVYDPSIHANSVVMAVYNTRGADDQIPLRIFQVVNGSFKVEGQTGQQFTWLAYTP
jgi:hypothetical protein